MAIFENFDFFREGEELMDEREGEEGGGARAGRELEKEGERDMGGMVGEAEKEKRFFFFFL